MDKSVKSVVLCLIATTIVISRALPIDYETGDVSGNSIDEKDVRFSNNAIENLEDYQDHGRLDRDILRIPELVDVSQKRNIISALQSKIRRSHPNEIEDRLRFSPVLSVDALGNLNGFFDNLATNLHTMENRNLLPNQMRLLGETDNKPKDSYGHSAAFVNSVSGNMWKRRFEENLSRIQQVRAYQAPMHIRKLMDYMPDSHRMSNFYDPVISRIGLGK